MTKPIIVPERRTVPVLFTGPGSLGMTLEFLPGDVVLFTPEEANRVIASGHAVPAQLVYHAPAKQGSRRRKKGAKS